METKLTLKLDEAIIKSAKKYAEDHKQSVSKLVENYFRNLTQESSSSPTYTKLVQELSGVIDEKDINNSDYVEYLEKKYE